MLARTFLRGLVAFLPLTLTVYLVYWMITTAENLVGEWIRRLIPNEFYRYGMGVMAGLVLIFALGVLMNLWVVRWLFRRFEKILNRIPLVKTIYGSVRDLMGFFQQGDSHMGQPVLVRLPNSDHRMLGFITREDFSDVPLGLAGQDVIAVYLPMGYQIGGFTILVPRSAVEPVAMGFEQAMRFCIAAGVTPKMEKTRIMRRPGEGNPAG